MDVVFCGTPQFAVPTLNSLLTSTEFNVLAVITQPDRPRGRGQQVSASPVKNTALAAGIPVHQPEKIRSPETEQLLQRLLAVAGDLIGDAKGGELVDAHQGLHRALVTPLQRGDRS